MSRVGRLPTKYDVDIDDGADDIAPDFVADRGFYFSADGTRRREEVLNVAHKKRCLEPTELNDQLGEWVPVPDDTFTQDGAREALLPSGESVGPTVLGKRKEYVSTTDPMSRFRPMMGFFLDELLRHEGLSDHVHQASCAHCKTVFGRDNEARLFKCYECGEHLQCETCCLSNHALSPLHVIQEWNGSFWVPCTLNGLGLVYQLGHGGFPCPFPDDSVHRMVVIEAPIIHQIQVRYCKCEKSDTADNLEQLMQNGWFLATVTDPGTCATFRSLEAYRLYNVVGNMNVQDFITAIACATDATAASGMTWLPEQYKQFQRMARQWAFLKRLLRAGRGHDPGGVDATKLGECAVNCWACPHDGRNLPPDWRNVDPKFKFLYMLLLAVDANFRLKNRMRANEIDDPSLGPGWGYWVEPKKYKRHVKKYVNEKDISTCIAFAALLQKDTRMTTGLRVSGVGGCVCARHECMRPNGLGDLQKGERYANMDYIVMAALAGFCLMLLTISYDIGCQWKIHLPERNERLPKNVRLPLKDVQIQYGLPVWHAASHNEDCRNANSLSLKPGVGKSDGEGVERVWSVLNPIAFSTKDAGRGQRADVIEGKIDNHNWLKNVGEGEALQRKLVVAIAERDTQVVAFKVVNSTLSKDVKTLWKKMISDWLGDESKPNPYTLSQKDCPTEAEVRLELRKDEDTLTAGGKAPLHGRSATAFLTAGIQIEDTQRRIIAELAGSALVAADRENKIEEWRHTLLVKIATFRNLQKIYMPGAAAAIAAAEANRDPDAVPPKPEKIKLWMPSEMQAESGDDTLRGCVRGLLGMEAQMRVAQCENSLVALRSRLHAKRFLITFRNENVTGQLASSRAGTLIALIGERVDALAKRYRKGREALLALEGGERYPHLKQLDDAHLTLDGDWMESDMEAREKLAMLGSGQGARAPRVAPGSSKRTMSWIWTAPGALEDGEARLHESIRVEWARAHARKERWTEEVMLLREEMRRVLRYLTWQSGWWRERAALRTELSAELAAGVRAYALKQAAWHQRLGGFFRTKWNVPALVAAQQLVAVDGAHLDDLFGQELAMCPLVPRCVLHAPALLCDWIRGSPRRRTQPPPPTAPTTAWRNEARQPLAARLAVAVVLRCLPASFFISGVQAGTVRQPAAYNYSWRSLRASFAPPLWLY
ncbi:hypothetical protein FB451DRAFT_1566624 [Mycena latifolia]|nr:hypothetical protein FB451DRAFT_1566624 [Mycena latifolia]